MLSEALNVALAAYDEDEWLDELHAAHCDFASLDADRRESADEASWIRRAIKATA